MTFPFRNISFLLLSSAVSLSQTKSGDDELKVRAQKLAQQCIIVDTHIDVPYRLNNKWEDISQRTEGGNFDYVRAKQGGLNAPFMSIYVPADREFNGSKSLADSLIDMVGGLVKRSPDKFAIAKSPADVTEQFRQGKISLCMGMENGSPIEAKIGNVKYFFDRGIRYITLAHSKDNHISDSSYDTTHTWKGLSPFGKQVVAEMNRLGIMVDVSHISDDAFFAVMQVSKAPAIASHSSCRFFTPGWERNMSDDMIKLLAKNGGIIMVNFGSDFVSDEYRKKDELRRKQMMAEMQARGYKQGDPALRELAEQYEKDHPLPYADVKDVAAHINHVVKLVGIEHVGFGSDFDGVGDSLPIGLKDVSQYPNLIAELLKLGYSDNDIRKICGENLLRVWRNVENVAKEMRDP